jgi:hypothetical protein
VADGARFAAARAPQALAALPFRGWGRMRDPRPQSPHVCPARVSGATLTAARRASRRGRSIGTEHEKFGFRTADKRPIDYSQVKHLLLGLVNR